MGNISGTIGGEGNSPGSLRGDSGERCEERNLGGIHASPEPEPSVQPQLSLRRVRIESMHADNQRPVPVMIMWSHGGRQVSVMGSWDNWARIKPMHRSGEEFVLMKLLPSGVYHYRFVVDGNPMCDQDTPFSFDDPGGNAYNILDVKEFVAESCENVPENMLPDSPEDNYGRNSIHDMDFSKPPPDLPPQMYKPLLRESLPSWTEVHQLLARPQHVVLNHLFVKSCDNQAEMKTGGLPTVSTGMPQSESGRALEN